MTEKTFATHLHQDRRLTILKLLEALPAYCTNSSIIATALQTQGLAASRDQVRTDLHWLTEQGLLKAEEVGSVLIVSATERGLDVARGLAVVPGVNRPGA